MNDLTTLLIIAAISVGIGVAVGGLISNAMNARQNPAKPGSEEKDGLVEIFSFNRDIKSKTSVLEIKGKKYRKPAELEAGTQAFLAQQLNILASWVGAPDAPKSAEFTTSESDSQVSQATRSPVNFPVSNPKPAQADSNSMPNDSLKQSYNPLGVFTRSIRSDTHKPSAPPSSIAAQIDEILQEKLAELPQEKRAIRLMELPGKGMVVMVGLEQYDGVEAVPDPEVKSLIRECVHEWEQKVDYQE